MQTGLCSGEMVARSGNLLSLLTFFLQHVSRLTSDILFFVGMTMRVLDRGDRQARMKDGDEEIRSWVDCSGIFL